MDSSCNHEHRHHHHHHYGYRRRYQHRLCQWCVLVFVCFAVLISLNNGQPECLYGDYRMTPSLPHSYHNNSDSNSIDNDGGAWSVDTNEKNDHMIIFHKDNKNNDDDDDERRNRKRQNGKRIRIRRSNSGNESSFHKNKNNTNRLNDFEKALVVCGMTSFVSLSDRSAFQAMVMKFVGMTGLPLIQYHDVGHHQSGHRNTEAQLRLEQFFRRSYIQNKQEYFVIVTEKPGLLLRQMESFYLRESYGEMALLPHKTKWIVILWTERQWTEFMSQQNNLVFDNVVAIQVKKQSALSSVYDLQRISTFMWRQNRTKEPSDVDLSSLTRRECVLFPNEKFALNGREIIVGAKVFLNLFLQVGESPINGTYQIKGILKDVLDYSSMYSNFTYVVEVAKYRFSEQGITWGKFERLIQNGAMDISLSSWSALNREFVNLSFSYPVLFDAFVGIYRRPYDNGFCHSWVFLCPFPPRIYLFLLMCVICSSSLYTLIVVYWNSFPLKPPEKQKKSPFLNDKLPSADSGKRNVIIKVNTGLMGTVLNILLYYFPRLFSFSAAALNQSYLPRPFQISARIVVGVWAVGMVFFYAIFSSSITAKMVSPEADLPFKTFNELLKRNDYKCTVLNETVLQSSMWLAEKGTPLAKLRTKTTPIVLNKHRDEPVDINLPHYLEHLEDNTVFLHYKSAIQTWLNGNSLAKNYVIMDNDPVFMSDISMAFPSHSELEDIISKDIHRLYETGIQKKLFINHSTFLAPSARSRREYFHDIRDKHEVIEIRDLFWLCMICLFVLLLSAGVLGLEILLIRPIGRKVRDIGVRAPNQTLLSL